MPTGSATPPNRPSGDRWRALDVFRFVAVCLMVQGHTFTALLDAPTRTARWFDWHRYVHGFTAPMFLFGAGLAFGITTYPRLSAHRGWGPATRKRLGRYLTILALGYVLHFPELRIREWHSAPWSAFASAFQVDALQLIAVCMLLLMVAARLARTSSELRVGATLLGAGVVLTGPWCWRLAVENALPLPIAAYFTPETGSLFPLVPWGGYVFAGTAMAFTVVRARAAGQGTTARVLLALGGGAMAVGAALRASGWNPFGAHDHWVNDPFHFVFRMGVLTTCVGAVDAFLLWRAHADRDSGRHASEDVDVRRARPGLLGTISQETLVVYVVHLVLLYGFAPGFGIEDHAANALGPGAAGLVAAGLFVVSAGAGLLWAWFRGRHPKGFAQLRVFLAVATVVALLSHW
ncbi:MAG: DUF1624 domain-containing protein [Myxococcales bacterium]|nr:DUF1624 domain-containing protein [Myxococcales bacterium]